MRFCLRTSKMLTLSHYFMKCIFAICKKTFFVITFVNVIEQIGKIVENH